jgi:hypothetical protein
LKVEQVSVDVFDLEIQQRGLDGPDPLEEPAGGSDLVYETGFDLGSRPGSGGGGAQSDVSF